MAHSKYNAKSKKLSKGGHFELTYDGKVDEATVLALTPIEWKTLAKGKGSSFFYGDNIDALLYLLNNGMKQKIKLIYIDPPYATKGVFESRDLEHAYEDIHHGAHFIEELRKRLILMRELLSEDGSIYVHMDGRMIFQIKIILDEIFGGENFRNMITRKKCNSKNYTRNQFGNVSDYILFYSKSASYTWNQQFEVMDEENKKKEYRHIDPNTGRKYMLVPIHAPGVRNGATGGRWREMLPPPGKHWQYTPDKLDEYDRQGDIVWSTNNNPRRKVYLDTRPGSPVQDIWLDYKDAHNQNIDITGYPTEKNYDLLRRIIEASSNPDDIVLDAFAGSGTTGFAAEKLKRRWIMMDNSPLSLKTIISRFSSPNGQATGEFSKQKYTSIPLLTLSPPFSIYSSVKEVEDILANKIGIIAEPVGS